MNRYQRRALERSPWVWHLVLRSKRSASSIPTPVSIDKPLLPDMSLYCPWLLSIYIKVKSSPRLCFTAIYYLLNSASTEHKIKADGFGMIVGAFCVLVWFVFFFPSPALGSSLGAASTFYILTRYKYRCNRGIAGGSAVCPCSIQRQKAQCRSVVFSYTHKKGEILHFLNDLWMFCLLNSPLPAGRLSDSAAVI